MLCLIFRSRLRLIATAFILVAPLELVGTTLRAQQAGVLLGYSQPTNDSHEYKSAWIVFSPTEARLVATVPDVIVPRSSGFWRVGLTVACEYEATSNQDSAREIVWQVPLEKAPIVEQGPLCKNQPGDVRDSEEDAASDSGAIQLCTHEAVQIHFVSPTHIAEESNTSDSCDPRGGRDITRNDVRLLDETEPISLADLFGDRATQAYSLAAKKGFEENSKEFNCPEPGEDEYDLKSWKINHLRGAWRPMASLDMLPGECAFFYQTNLQLPKTVTGETAKPELWRGFAAAIPHLADFFLSALGDYALVLVQPKNAEYHLYAYAVQNGAPGKRLAEIPWDNSNSHPIVMAQWSAGKYVAVWTSVIVKIQDHPLPAPVLKPGAPPAASVQ